MRNAPNLDVWVRKLILASRYARYGGGYDGGGLDAVHYAKANAPYEMGVGLRGAGISPYRLLQSPFPQPNPHAPANHLIDPTDEHSRTAIPSVSHIAHVSPDSNECNCNDLQNLFHHE